MDNLFGFWIKAYIKVTYLYIFISICISVYLSIYLYIYIYIYTRPAESRKRREQRISRFILPLQSEDLKLSKMYSPSVFFKDGLMLYVFESLK